MTSDQVRWAVSPLGLVTHKIGSGATPRGGERTYAESGTPLIRSMNVRFGGLRHEGLAYLSAAQAEELSNVTVHANDVLLNITGASIGRVTLAPADMAGARVNQHVAIIRLAHGIEPAFVRAFLASPAIQATIGDENYGVTRPALTKSMIEQIELPVPPLAEQRRIVAKLDALMARTAAARAELDRTPGLAARYKQAVLRAAFDGPGTDTEAWPVQPVSAIVTNIVAGKNLRCEERPPRADELGVVKVSAVTWGRFDAGAAKTLPAAFCPPERTRISTGDFLLSRANTLELVGAVVVVEDAPTNLFLSDKVLRLEMPEAAKRWLMWFLRSPQGRAAIEAGATGNQLSMRNLSQAALGEIEVPWPDAADRSAMVATIETAFAEIDRLAAEAAAARRLLDRLDQAILAKAFRGELVPQDAADEPASVLLDRIRAERAAAPADTRRRKVTAS